MNYQPQRPVVAHANFSPDNPLGIRAFDHIEFYVDDAKKWADYFCTRFGMHPRAIGSPASGLPGRLSYVIGQGRVTYVLTQADGHGADAEAVAAHVSIHGNGVHDVAFRVRDAAAAYAEALRRGARSAEDFSSVNGYHARAIHTYGDTIHTLVERLPGTPFAPGYIDVPGGADLDDINFAMIDHVVANVEHMDEWVDFYHRVFAFEPSAHFNIDTGRSSLMSKVLGNGEGYIKLPINEPSSRNSQIQEYLDVYRGPGVQHIALLTPDILATVAQMRRNGVEFTEVPDAYYESLAARVGEIRESLAALRESSILVDRDRPDGYLLQIFTQCPFDRPTLFHEVIQRRGNSEGFGEGNFTALFEAIEREQMKRGSM